MPDLITVSARCHHCGAPYTREIEAEWARMVRLCDRCMDILETEESGMTELAVKDNGAALLERVMLDGDLSNLKPAERIMYYRRVCESVGLNPLTRPFEYLRLSGKLVLYARKDATDQIRLNRGVSITKVERELVDGIFTATAYGMDKDGRLDSEIGAVSVAGLQGPEKANAMMKALTKAKRRLTLALGGLTMLDESELDSVPGAQIPAATVDHETGEIVGGAAEMDERDQLLAQAKDLGDALGLKAPARAAAWATHVGQYEPTNAPVEGLKKLVEALTEQAQRAGK